MTGTRGIGLALLLAACALGACRHVGAPDEPWTDGPSSDGDVDGDSDGDADGDSDGDADADTDPPGCPVNSGWPCTCTVDATCDDGSLCISLDSIGVGEGSYCAAQCWIPGEPCPPTIYDAEAECALTDNQDNFWCILVCTSADQCPPDQDCWDTGQGASICLP